MKTGILAAVLKPKGKGDYSKEEASEPEGEEDMGGDKRAVMKEAAEDGDWSTFVDALCSYVDMK